ncbi:DUF4113 domain-containing protein [Pseudomonas aeruginosa]|nr:DUF4113 domain-containing protein [Pseudomonas aeruginosa]QOD51085.1 DUF4113 domain-containing protein [Pseudomonas aeruginosa]QQW00125.1 DUF4113 domain-containing protein [Pseudomonas aeruginosa]UJC27160.1 DUF4113 domain-containing protein [Pseudomonas aeruginosa]HBO9793441.1 DUF4113 domain-containing protein [Pseudomonas aeruginosa]
MLGRSRDIVIAAVQPVASEKVMQVMDRINSKWGRGTLRLGGVPVTPDWGCVGKCSAQAIPHG